MAIIGLPIEPSTILVPDNPDDILPPGYVEDGILDGVTNPDGSIITDENDLAVTGECVDNTDPCTEYWCLDDGAPPGYLDPNDCPPGYTLECVKDTNYPVLPPGQYDCTIVANDSGTRGAYTTEAGNCVMIGNNYIRFYDKDMNPGAYVGSKYRDAAHDQGFVWLMTTGGFSTVYKYEDGTGNFISSRNLLDEYGLELQSGETCMSASDGYIALGGAINLHGERSDGTLLLNYDMEFVRLIPGNNYERMYVMGGKLITSTPTLTNIAVREFDGTFVKWLPLPDNKSGYFFYQMVNLFTVEGVTRFAVVEGDLKDALGIDAVTPYYSTLWRVTLYDENFDIVKTIQSPQTGGAVKTAFGGSISRYGKYIMIGESRCSSEGVAGGGGATLFDTDGNYVKSIIMTGVSPVTTNGYYGCGVFLTENQTVCFSSFNADKMRICQNNPPVI